MSRYLLLFVIFAVVVTAAVYWPLASNARKSASSEFAKESAKQVLLREAKLIEYFCLSKIPPTIGEANIPKAWEKALKSSIDLYSNLREVSGKYPAFRERGEDLTRLSGGEAVYVQSEDYHYLAYEPRESPSFYVVIAKPESELRMVSAELSGGMSPLVTAVIPGVICALLLTVATRYVTGEFVRQKQ